MQAERIEIDRQGQVSLVKKEGTGNLRRNDDKKNQRKYTMLYARFYAMLCQCRVCNAKPTMLCLLPSFPTPDMQCCIYNMFRLEANTNADAALMQMLMPKEQNSIPCRCC